MRYAETERRWILKDLKWPAQSARQVTNIRQGYLDTPGHLRVRITDGKIAELTRKLGFGAHRVEVTERISVEAAQMLLATTPCHIEKRRHAIADGWELDLFSGPLEGLVIVEREFASTQAAQDVELPQWVLDSKPHEVTSSLTNYILAHTAGYTLDPVNRPRIVLTGAPCSGKTTYMREAATVWEKAQCVPEVATLLMHRAAIFPDADGSFQRTYLRVQRSLERGAVNQAAMDDKAFVLLDRGTVDAAAFMYGGMHMFEQICATTIDEEYARYSRVIMLDLPPPAVYAEQQANNPIRRVSYEEALAVQDRIYHVWCAHPNFTRITTSESWESKSAAITAALAQAVQSPIA